MTDGQIILNAIGAVFVITVVIPWMVVNVLTYTSHWYYKLTGRKP